MTYNCIQITNKRKNKPTLQKVAHIEQKPLNIKTHVVVLSTSFRSLTHEAHLNHQSSARRFAFQFSSPLAFSEKEVEN